VGHERELSSSFIHRAMMSLMIFIYTIVSDPRLSKELVMIICDFNTIKGCALFVYLNLEVRGEKTQFNLK